MAGGETFLDEPEPMDIICGRGKNITHPGNKRFHSLIMSNRQVYQQTKRREDKTVITQSIIERLKRGPDPSRFVLRDAPSSRWVEVSDDYAKEKVSHALRSLPKPWRKKTGDERKKYRKPVLSSDAETLVSKVLQNQQQLLRAMIQNASTKSNDGQVGAPLVTL